MAIDISQIQLSESDRRLLAEVAQRSGKSWSEVLQEALKRYLAAVPASKRNGEENQSWYDSLSRHGLVGCLHGGPPDLSTNPKYMEGFGEGD
jgi:hypothetical protein